MSKNMASVYDHRLETALLMLYKEFINLWTPLYKAFKIIFNSAILVLWYLNVICFPQVITQTC